MRVKSSLGPAESLKDYERKQLEQNVADMTRLLNNKLETGLGKDAIITVWAASQIVVAVDGITSIDKSEVTGFINKHMYHDCNCWREFPGASNHIGATAWALIALTRMRAPENDELLTFILDNQKTNGWWPIFPAQDKEENASTYATAICLLALKEHLSSGLVKAQNKDRVERALEQGRNWLLSTRVGGKSRWEDYPSAVDKKESISLSGMVLHVLHRLGPSVDSSLDKNWLQSMPSNVPPALAFEIAAHQVDIGPNPDYIAMDHVRYYIIPWVIIATKDAFESGTISERTRGVEWLREIIKNENELERQALKQPWVAAEYLISFRYLQGEKVI